MGLSFGFLYNNFFNKKQKTTYLLKNKNFILVLFMMGLLGIQYAQEHELEEINKLIAEENKKLRLIRSLY